MKLRPKPPVKTEYELLKDLARVAHSKINICGGTIQQHQLYLYINASGKHLEVHEEYPIPLVLSEGEECSRKTHKQDILIVDEDEVLAINSKGASFNNTNSFTSELSDAKIFKKSVEALFPDKKVTYMYIKENYVRGKSKTKKYDQFADAGFTVVDAETYINENYGDYSIVQKNREQAVIDGFKEAFTQDYNALLEVLQPGMTPKKVSQRKLHSRLDLL